MLVYPLSQCASYPESSGNPQGPFIDESGVIRSISAPHQHQHEEIYMVIGGERRACVWGGGGRVRERPTQRSSRTPALLRILMITMNEKSERLKIGRGRIESRIKEIGRQMAIMCHKLDQGGMSYVGEKGCECIEG